MSNLPKESVSYWMESVKFKDYPSLNKDLNVDVAIIGGGITGITSAFLLKQKGLKVSLVDVDKVAAGTTGHTTAKLTIQHGLKYDKLIKNFGHDKASTYAESNKVAQDFVVSLIKDKKIDCDLEMQSSYIYTQSKNYISQIENEARAAESLRIPSEYLNSLTLPFKIDAAVCFYNQYQFHPLKYLKHLCDEINKDGDTIFESTKALDIEENKEGERKLKVSIKGGKDIYCDYAIMACHFPYRGGTGIYPIKMYQEKSYVVVAKTQKPYNGGMYINVEDPTRSLRSIDVYGQKAVSFGGESHKAGSEHDTIKHYEAVLAFAEETYGVSDVLYRWSTQDTVPLDDVPYIGNLTGHHENVFVATGFNKWGMTTSAAAAILLRDKIVDKYSPWEELYKPTRFNIRASIKNLLSNTGGVVTNLIVRKLTPSFDFISELSNDEGRIVTVDGSKMGAYKDKDGEIHLVESACTHLRCELQWNSAEKSWDCPCHGSRFTIDGEVIEGPALERLSRVVLEDDNE